MITIVLVLFCCVFLFLNGAIFGYTLHEKKLYKEQKENIPKKIWEDYITETKNEENMAILSGNTKKVLGTKSKTEIKQRPRKQTAGLVLKTAAKSKKMSKKTY